MTARAFGFHAGSVRFFIQRLLIREECRNRRTAVYQQVDESPVARWLTRCGVRRPDVRTFPRPPSFAAAHIAPRAYVTPHAIRRFDDKVASFDPPPLSVLAYIFGDDGPYLLH